MQLALVASAELHLQVTMELEKLKRDSIMSVILMRNKVGKEEWTLEALIVSLSLFLDTYKPHTKYEQSKFNYKIIPMTLTGVCTAMSNTNILQFNNEE